MGAPAYECPTKTTGPSMALTRVAIDSASEASPRSGLGIATTVWPSLFSSRITPPNPDASANAPCTRTIVAPGTSLGPIPLPIPICGCDIITPFRRGRIYLQASRLHRVPVHSYTWDRLDTILAMNGTGIRARDLLDLSVGQMHGYRPGGRAGCTGRRTAISARGCSLRYAVTVRA